jgi:hypothetical protein
LADAWNLVNVPHGGLGSNGEIGMIGILYGLDIANSPFGGASWSWTLPSNNSSLRGRPENPTNIVDLLDFPTCSPMNLTSNEALWLVLVCQLDDSMWFLPKNQW